MGINDVISNRIIEKLGDCNLIFGQDKIRIHDLTIDIINKMDTKGEEIQVCHANFLNTYIEKQSENSVREWWDIQDDGYIFKKHITPFKRVW